MKGEKIEEDRQILFIRGDGDKKVKGSDETLVTATDADDDDDVDNKTEEEDGDSPSNNNKNRFLTLVFLSLWMAARTVMNRTRLALSAIRQPSHVREKMVLGLVLLILTLTLIVYFGLTLKDAFIALLEAKKNQIQALGPIMYSLLWNNNRVKVIHTFIIRGHVLLSFLVLFCTLPIMIGYSISLYYCGYVYGFPYGWIPAFSGATAGSILVYLIARYFCADFVRRRYGSGDMMQGIERAIARKGFLMMWLIRLSPYPFGWVSTIMGVIPSVTFGKYLVSTVLALPKTLFHIYIGSTLSSLLHMHHSDSSDSESKDDPNGPLIIVFMVVGSILVIGSTSYIVSLVRREMNRGANPYITISSENTIIPLVDQPSNV